MASLGHLLKSRLNYGTHYTLKYTITLRFNCGLRQSRLPILGVTIDTRYTAGHHSVKLQTAHQLKVKRQSHFQLTGELWVAFVCYVEKSDREVPGAHCSRQALTQTYPSASDVLVKPLKYHMNQEQFEIWLRQHMIKQAFHCIYCKRQYCFRIRWTERTALISSTSTQHKFSQNTVTVTLLLHSPIVTRALYIYWDWLMAILHQAQPCHLHPWTTW